MAKIKTEYYIWTQWLDGHWVQTSSKEYKDLLSTLRAEHFPHHTSKTEANGVIRHWLQE